MIIAIKLYNITVITMSYRMLDYTHGTAKSFDENLDHATHHKFIFLCGRVYIVVVSCCYYCYTALKV